MENSFKDSIRLKVDKKSGTVHLSLRSSEYKVDVYKIQIGDMATLVSQFTEGMRKEPDVFVAEPDTKNEETSSEETAE